MTPIVVDTGVVVAAVIEEEDSARAVKLFRAAANGAYRPVAPDFMAIEFGNVLWKYVNQGLLSAEEARRHIERFPYDRFEWLPARILLPEAFRFATEHSIAVYDAAFLAAAASLGMDLITADEALHRKVGGRLSWVRLLRDFDGG